MSVILAVTAAGIYAALVIGVHRWNIGRLRARGGFSSLLRLDWEALVEELLPRPPPTAAWLTGVPAQLPSGDPTPALLRREVPPEVEPRRALLAQLVAGSPPEPSELAARAQAAGFTGGEVGWLQTLALVKTHPEKALERLEALRPTSAAELYLREWLRLTRRTHSANLELNVFATKRRVALALARWGDAPCLYYLRAFASSLVGLNRAAIDDLARAVYFSQQRPFFLRAVLDTPYIAEVRPALVYQCRHALESAPG